MSAKRGTGTDAPYRLGRQSGQPGFVAARACDATLTLRRAKNSRPSGSWQDEDFDVFNGEQCVGRVYRVTDQPDSLRFWGVCFQVIARKSYGYTYSLDDAKAAFRGEYERWQRERL